MASLDKPCFVEYVLTGAPESVEPARRRDPDAAFTIFEEAADDVTGQAIRFRKRVRPTVLNMYQPSVLGSDPEGAIAVAQQLVRIDIPSCSSAAGVMALRIG